MSIRGSNFENQHPFASDHALVWERCMPDGLLYGVDMSFSATLFTLGTGFMIAAGRMFEITAAESISVSPGSGYARIYVAIDTGGAATENSFDQVSFGVDYAASLAAFPDLTQGEININQGAAVYQAEVAVLNINSSGIVSIERQMELVSPGAGTGAFAAISVTYPEGSICTCTDGVITYTAPNTSGGALFIIPYAATWTVSCTDGTETASEDVVISTEGQSVSVELKFWNGELYDSGNEYKSVTGGWTGAVASGSSGSTVTLEDAYIFINKTTGSNISAITNNEISFEGFSTLNVSLNRATSTAELFLQVYEDKDGTTNLAKTQITGSGDKTASVDLTGIASGYPNVRATGNTSSGANQIKIYKVWME